MEISETLEHQQCPSCGIHFGVPKAYIKHRRDDPKKNFHCPNGHALSWPNEKTVGQLQEEVNALTAKNKELSTANATLRSQLDQLEAKFADTDKGQA